MARQIEKAEFFNSRAKQHNSWLQQAAEALEIDLDDDMLMGKWKFLLVYGYKPMGLRCSDRTGVQKQLHHGREILKTCWAEGEGKDCHYLGHSDAAISRLIVQ